MTTRRLPEQLTLTLGLDEPDDAAALQARVARQLGVGGSAVGRVRLLKRSIDARHGRVRFRLLLGLGDRSEAPGIGGAPLRECADRDRVVVVGDGPAGLFCAYQLARHGIGCSVLDRGKPVASRRRDIRQLATCGALNPESNYCFGEGGAGAYSDGKLYTRSRKRGNVRDVLELFVLHGAPRCILTDARPHVGSDRLPAVVTQWRERLQQVGVGFRFEARVTELLVEQRGGRAAVAGVRLGDGTELSARQVVLATGHSAVDVYGLLHQLGVSLRAKPFAVGLRIEHPQALINRIQYGDWAGHPRLPAATYRLACEVGGRGVYSFCMCPGGSVVPTATEPDRLVVNGMSRAQRGGPYGNSGLVVEVKPQDLEAAGYPLPLGGLQLLRRIEQAAYVAGGGALHAPATRATDFVGRRASTTLPASSYPLGLCATDVAAALDSAGVKFAERLRRALGVFERKMRGLLTDEAVLIGVETRTSSPVWVLRDPESLVTPELAGLYPCGEGAGYAGGIVSCALDGMRVANRIARDRGHELGRTASV